MATKNKEYVIAERVKMKMKAEIIAFVLMCVFTVLAMLIIFMPIVATETTTTLTTSVKDLVIMFFMKLY